MTAKEFVDIWWKFDDWELYEKYPEYRQLFGEYDSTKSERDEVAKMERLMKKHLTKLHKVLE